MIEITGKQVIKTNFTGTGKQTFSAWDPSKESTCTDIITEATADEVDTVCMAAREAFELYSKVTGLQRAIFLETIAENILLMGDQLIETAHAETGLPLPRLMGERGRTVDQLLQFAKLLKEGSWVRAIIDTAEPERRPVPKPDIRQMEVPLGPVAVFGASNFPFAFSVAGGDTVSALAAGCPVIFKAHPSHPATCEIMATAIINAIKACDMPHGVFGMVQGISHEVGGWLVAHPAIKAVGFTGSFSGGKALYDIAVRRAEPIPVYAEMGSVNPVFFLPGILKDKAEILSKGFAASITLGVGQFCTNPGLFVTLANAESKSFIEQTKTALEEIKVGPMLNKSIRDNYLTKVNELGNNIFLTTHTGKQLSAVAPQLFSTNVTAAMQDNSIVEEIFGPSSVGVLAESKDELLSFAKHLQGHLTATVYGTNDDLQEYRELIDILQMKVGRLVVNGFPTGVEVTHAMVHGGPYPATTDSRSTSVGTTAIYRFTRPVCYQDFPDFLLPAELKEGNPLQILRTVNGGIE